MQNYHYLWIGSIAVAGIGIAMIIWNEVKINRARSKVLELWDGGPIRGRELHKRLSKSGLRLSGPAFDYAMGRLVDDRKVRRTVARQVFDGKELTITSYEKVPAEKV